MLADKRAGHAAAHISKQAVYLDVVKPKLPQLDPAVVAAAHICASFKTTF
jgi:hypothetical protein